MGTIAQGDRMTEMILKYRKERPVDPVDREFLDDLRRAAMIPYTVRYGGLYAVSGPICRGLVPKPSARFRTGWSRWIRLSR